MKSGPKFDAENGVIDRSVRRQKFYRRSPTPVMPSVRWLESTVWFVICCCLHWRGLMEQGLTLALALASPETVEQWQKWWVDTNTCCRLVGSVTHTLLTTSTDIWSSFHCADMSECVTSNQIGYQGASWAGVCSDAVAYWGQFWWPEILLIIFSVTAFYYVVRDWKPRGLDGMQVWWREGTLPAAATVLSVHCTLAIAAYTCFLKHQWPVICYKNIAVCICFCLMQETYSQVFVKVIGKHRNYKCMHV